MMKSSNPAYAMADLSPRHREIVHKLRHKETQIIDDWKFRTLNALQNKHPLSEAKWLVSMTTYDDHNSMNTRIVKAFFCGLPFGKVLIIRRGEVQGKIRIVASESDENV